MARNTAFATKLPGELVDELNDVCKRFGLRKNFVVEQALREKIEDILDTLDLQDAVKEADSFHDWKDVKTGTKGSLP